MHVRLNARKLYQADGHSVQEMLKLVSLLFSASDGAQPEESVASGADDAQAASNFEANHTQILNKVSRVDLCRRQTNFIQNLI